MYWELYSELAVLSSVVILCTIIIGNAINKLSKVLPYRVNCWFCNSNAWVPFPERNCWTCASCDQYNGFTKDGDYNRPLPATPEQTYKPFNSLVTPPSNGLCHMCNINQQLKVAQLANFVPMNETTYDREITAYKVQLEKAYKLCAYCRKVLKSKLHKEKETLLGSKLLQKRSPKKNKPKDRKITKIIIKYLFVTVSTGLLVLITLDCYNHLMRYQSIKTNLYLAIHMIYGFFESLTAILKAKAFLTFPILQEYEDISMPINMKTYYDELMTIIVRMIPNVTAIVSLIPNIDTQRFFGGIGCLATIMCHLFKKNLLKYQIVADILWTILLFSLITRSLTADVLLAVKFITAAMLFLTYKSVNLNPKISIFASSTVSPKRMKNLAFGKNDSYSKAESDSDLETDDDVSLSQYGFDSSTTFSDSKSPSNMSFVSRKTNLSSTRKPASLWSFPATNSAFNRSSPFFDSPLSRDGFKKQQTSLKKPEFNKYQDMETFESDSELDAGINGLNLGTTPNNKSHPCNLFSIKNFESPLNFTVPTKQQRQLICPSKLGQGTSWVAGGYWGRDVNADTFDVAASRSSSQSSGFESQASSLQRVFSLPLSRAESVCSELDRTSIFSDPPQFGINSNSLQNNLGSLRSPVHPQMRYDSHIHIPLPLSSQKMRNPFATYPDTNPSQMYPQIKRSSGLIKLPNVYS